MTSAFSLAALPPSLKAIAHDLKTATEHETRDPVVTYWCRLAALQAGLKLDKSSKEALAVLLPLMDWLEKEKKVLADDEAVTSEVVASAHVENYAMKLFGWADKEDRAGRFNKNVVKSFYTAGILFDVLVVFGELTPENAHAKKYSKWKAAYIHNCLKNGETPVPGPAASGEEEEEGGEGGAVGGWQMPQIPSQDPAAADPPPAAAPKPVPTPRANPPPVFPSAVPTPAMPSSDAGATTTSDLTPEQKTKAQKYCKFASSALDYADKAAAIDNLQKALRLLQTGHDQ